MINVMDFENADIGRLAVHLAEAWRPEPAETIALTVGTDPVSAYTGYGVLLGWSFTDTAGADANTLTLQDGADTDGPIIAQLSVAANASAVIWAGVPGIRVVRGVLVTAAAAGTAVVYLARHRRHD